jgi:hypothetical protein
MRSVSPLAGAGKVERKMKRKMKRARRERRRDGALPRRICREEGSEGHRSISMKIGPGTRLGGAPSV